MEKLKRNKLFLKMGIWGLFVILLSTSNLNAQSCGLDWGLVHYGGSHVIFSVTNNGSRFVAVGTELVLVSDDGLNWAKGTPPRRTNQYCVTYAGDKFVAVGSDNHISTSSNGYSWTERRYINGTGPLWGVAYGDGTVVAAGENGVVLTSPDGITWTKRNSGTTKRFYDITFGEGKFVAVDVGGGFYSSSDKGVTWVFHGNASDGLICVTYGNGKFVAGGREGLLYTSPDGTSWTKRNSGVKNFFRSLCATPSGFVGVGNRTTGRCMIVTSPDGINWTWRESYVDSLLLGVTANNDMTVAIGLCYITSSRCSSGSNQLVLAAPNGGEEWSGGEKNKIFWGSFGTVGNVMLEYSANNGSTWNTIIDSTANDCIYAWTIPNESSTQCKVRVSEVGDNDPADTSASTFKIGGVALNTINITSPKGGENWAAGSKHNITWNGSTSFSKIDIEYYDGNTWNVIINGTPDDGSYTWTIPDIATTNARIWIKGYDGGTNPTDYSGTFAISGGQSTLNTITLLAPNGGEMLTAGNNYSIRWEGSVTFSKIDIEYYNGSTWNVIINGTTDDGVHNWTVPDISTSGAKIWIKGYDGGTNPTDYSNETFTISPAPTGSITVTSPNGGEVWARGSKENITWTSSGDVGNVRIYYSTDSGLNWSTIVSSTANDGTYAWTLPNIIEDNCLVKISDQGNSQISDVSNNVFSIGGPPEIVLNKNRFNFGYIKNGATPCTQTLFISNGGGGTLNWSAAADVSWINLSPASGTGGKSVTISINPNGLSANTYMGTISVSDPNVENSPQTAAVYLTVKNSNQDEMPFGIFATPEDGLTNVSGSIGVTGWALDDTCVESVKIYRQVNGGLSFIGDAVFVEGARPDVEEAHPDYPNNSRAGWGYMMLTNFLPDGQLVLKAIARDTSGKQIELGTKTIYVDNENAVKPFGAIDSPTQGGGASGTKYRNNGWALTPQPNKIPAGGTTIRVFIDSVYVGNATYNLYRADIATLFPDYTNTNGAWAYLDFDTTAYANGVHTIAWSVTDNAGNTDGVGSRYFSIQNTGGVSGISDQAASTAMFRRNAPLRDIPLDYFEPIAIRKGFDRFANSQVIHPDEKGALHLETRELERVEINLGSYSTLDTQHTTPGETSPGRYTGYLVVGDQLRPLPIGSNLDSRRGVFGWQPGPGFLGAYEFIFVKKSFNGETIKTNVHIKINPGSGVKSENLEETK